MESAETRIVETSQTGLRLDVFLVYHFPDYSRTLLRNAITAGSVSVDGGLARPAYRLNAGQTVRILLPELPRSAPQAEDIPLDVLYEDDWVVAINKPPGMVVHPARGHWSGTLASALQFRYGVELSEVGGPSRPGIVHRLDRDTSGVILIARNDVAHAKLSTQFEQRQVQKQYLAITYGTPLRERDWIDAPIGPHPSQREKKMIRPDSSESRPARTFYEVAERFDGFTRFQAFPKTGRTHQIRLHLTHIGHPIAGDALYSTHAKILLGELRRDHHLVGISPENAVPPPDAEFETIDWEHLPPETLVLSRQALHAQHIEFHHPQTGEAMSLEAPLPPDLELFLKLLRRFRRTASTTVR